MVYTCTCVCKCYIQERREQMRERREEEYTGKQLVKETQPGSPTGLEHQS